MKLRNLNGTIRKTQGVFVNWTSPSGKSIPIKVDKSSLLAGLKEAFGDDATVETGLTVNERGFLYHEGHPADSPHTGAQSAPPAAADTLLDDEPTPAEADDLSDLLG